MRTTVDCRDLDTEWACSVAFAADTSEDLMVAVLAHAIGVHREPDTPELRARIRNRMGEQTQPAL